MRPAGTKQQPGELERLMKRYQEADAAAGAALVESLTPQLFQFFRAQSRSRADAEDLLQDFWLRIHNARATYRPGEPVLPWVYAIAHRARIDEYRKRRRVVEHEIVDDGAVQSARAGSPKTDAGVPELLRGLPESQRELLIMLKVSGLSLVEAARATGSTVGAVKQKAHRAYENLRKLLGGAE
jgi:RNA polymerase sigma-70 factor (ECF subfamily)